MRFRVRTPEQSYRAAERRAEAERAAGIPDRMEPVDVRGLCVLDLRGAGGPLLEFEPRRGYHAWRARDAATGEVIDCAALKTLIHAAADKLPRMAAPQQR